MRPEDRTKVTLGHGEDLSGRRVASRADKNNEVSK